MNNMKKVLIAILIFMGMSVAVNAAKVYGTLDLDDYDDYEHDSKGGTLALIIEKESETTILKCTLVTFDKKAVEKIRVQFVEAIGSDKVEIICFEKTWALLKVKGEEETYYSIKLGKKEVTILGTALDTEFKYQFMSGKDIVSVLNSSYTCQLFNQKMETIGSSVVLIGKAHSLNDGKYFHCSDSTITKIYKVKKGFEEVISETGDYEKINEQKRICCIKNDYIHKICKY